MLPKGSAGFGGLTTVLFFDNGVVFCVLKLLRALSSGASAFNFLVKTGVSFFIENVFISNGNLSKSEGLKEAFISIDFLSDSIAIV